MGNPRSAWGIDIGNRALKAIKLVRDASGVLRVDDFDIVEHDTPLSSAGDNRDSLVQNALAHFIQRHPAKGGVVGVSVSGSSSLARFIKLPPVEAKKIPDIVRFEAIQQIPFPLDDVEWSYQLFKEENSPEVEVGIFAMRKELINHQLKFFTDVGLNVETVQLNPLAVYNAMQFDQRVDGATMIIDLGSENTDLIIADGQTIWLRSIPVGGKNFTDVLVKQFKLPFPKAEELKRTAATSKYAKQIFQAMRPVFADLVAEVQRSIGFYSSVHRESRLKKVLALGGTFRLPGLQKYLQQNLQLDVARIDHLEAGAPNDAKQRAVFEENLLSMASAYGLAIQAMGEGKITSSLLPASIRREKMWKDKTPWFAAAAAAFVLGTGVAMGSYFLQKFQYDQNAPTRSRLQQDVLAPAGDLDNRWNNVETQGSGDRQRIANIQSMLWYRDLWPGITSDIYAAVPTPKNFDPADPIKVPRANRDILQIDSISVTYDTDLSKLGGGTTSTPVATPDTSGGGPPGGPPMDMGRGGMPMGGFGGGVVSTPTTGTLPNVPPIPAGTHGFRITINLITPFGGDTLPAYKFAEDTFVKNLRALTIPQVNAKKDYVVFYAEVTSRQLMGENDDYKRQIQQRIESLKGAASLPTQLPTGVSAPSNPQYTSPMSILGGRMGRFIPGEPPPGMSIPPQPNPGGGAPTDTYNDPQTGEDMTHDTLLVVTALVLIDPPNAPLQGLLPPTTAPSAPGS
jgi:type IV pilus assembly protein PilM